VEELTLLAPHEEYEEIIRYWDGLVEADPCRETYTQRWRARLKHPSWEDRRQSFLWYTHARCEDCGIQPDPKDLQLHHLHYDTLWYENNNDLQLLCPGCHRIADEARAEEALAKTTSLSLEERAHAYMETANRWSGQRDWPISFRQALDIVSRL